MNIFVKQFRLPMCSVDIGIQQIHSILRSVTSTNVSINDRMNEYIHMKNTLRVVVSFAQYSHSMFFDFDVKTVCAYALVSFFHSSLFPSWLYVCTIFCFALLYFTLFHSTCIRTHSFSKQKHELTIGMYVCMYQHIADVYVYTYTNLTFLSHSI